ncbi:enoyl-CoA hydratase [Rhizobium sp. ACO-34A]|nr:enoyl-CoA hydratase-related protein [Rhizobium sp. ACO-34A]ATN35912.1 enoyl-CoA hydratase [Rhizobium sp. ACO-34A]
MGDELLRERHGSALWLTLNRLEVHNALNAALTRSLVEAFEEASVDPTLRTVVLTGAGERSFCSGADLKESAGGMFRSDDGGNPIAGVLNAIETCEKLVIARINGSVLAGGLGLVAACDLAYAARHAKFGLPEVRVGLFPMMVAARLMPKITLRHLQEMAYLGESIDAVTALQYGLINSIAPVGDLDELIADVLEKLGRNSAEAISAGKRALREMRSMTNPEILAFAERRIAEIAETDDAREGRAAFAEKRKPRWSH